MGHPLLDLPLSFNIVPPDVNFHVELLYYLGSEHERTNYRKLLDRKQRPSCSLYVTLNALPAAHSHDTGTLEYLFLNEARAPWLKNCLTWTSVEISNKRHDERESKYRHLLLRSESTLFLQLNKRNRCQLASSSSSSFSFVLLYSCFFASDTQYFSPLRSLLLFPFLFILFKEEYRWWSSVFFLSTSFNTWFWFFFFAFMKCYTQWRRVAFNIFLIRK